MAKSDPHTGSRFDDFLKEEGIYDEVQARALKRAHVGDAQAGNRRADGGQAFFRELVLHSG